MRFDDSQWNEIIVIAQGKKLAEQQAVIDAENVKKLLARIIERENELIATGAILYSDGLGKVYRKGTTSVSEQMIRECIPEGWPKIIEVFRSVQLPEAAPEVKQYPKTPSESYSAPVKEEPKELSDEEKLFNYASALEKVEWPGLKSKEATETFNKAQEKLNEAINILRQ